MLRRRCSQGPKSSSIYITVLHPDVFGHAVFFRLRIGEVSDTPRPPVVVDECPKIFDLPCIWIFERTFVSFENIFVFNSLSANPTKWPNTLKQFVGELFECLATLLILCLKG